MSRRNPFLEVIGLIFVLVLVLTPVAGFLNYHSSPTVTAEVVNTRVERAGGHEIRSWAEVTNTDNETGVACVRFVFEEQAEQHAHTDCKSGVEPGETVTLYAERHADGKSVTRRDIRRMDVQAYAEEERDPNSIFALG